MEAACAHCAEHHHAHTRTSCLCACRTTISLTVFDSNVDVAICDAQLCKLNHALRTISYLPDKDFNTEYFVRTNGQWVPTHEALSVEISQISGPTTLREAKIIVKAVNDPPTLDIVQLSEPTPELKRRWADIYMCGGDVPCECPASALACVRIADPDSCEMKLRNKLDCWDDSTSHGNVRLTVKTTKADIFFFDSEDLLCRNTTTPFLDVYGDPLPVPNSNLCEGSAQQRQAIFTTDLQRNAMPGTSVGARLQSVEVSEECHAATSACACIPCHVASLVS
jgi:hypothetical protein